MHKLIWLFKSPFSLPVVLLIAAYAYWLFLIPTKLFLSNSDLILGMECLTIYLIIVVLGRIFIHNRYLYFLPYILVIPLSLVGIYFDQLYVFLMFIFGFYLTRPVIPFLAVIILGIVMGYKQIPKSDRRQLVFFLSTLPIFAFPIFNFIVYCPVIWSAEKFGGYRYYVVETIWDYPHSNVDFYKCKKFNFQCEILDGIQSGRSEIIIDEEKKEVSFMGPRGLLYTDGSTPRKYTGHEGGRLGNNIYFLSERCNNFNYNGRNECESYTFVPYKCNLDYKSCDPIPVEIENNYDSYFYWEEDKVNKELQLRYSDDEILILTLGKDLKCYTDECKMMQQ